MSQARDLVVIGGGGHARVVLEAALSRPDLWRVLGYTDRANSSKTTSQLGVPWLGTDEQCAANTAGAAFVLGVGAVEVTGVRQRIVDQFPTSDWATIVHARAYVSATASLGAGTVVLAGAVINSGAVVGGHCIVNTGAIVEHDVTCGSYVIVAPGAAIGGSTVIGESSYLGLGCRIRNSVQIGPRVLVAMGAVVTSSLGENSCVAGVPAKPFQRSRANA